MKIQEALTRLLAGGNLDALLMEEAMQQVMTGEATPAQIGAFLAALRMKGETVDEVAAAASVMRRLAEPVNLDSRHAVDIVGTGGDATSTFNISTCTALVAAAAGVPVAKHGNRSVSSRSGAADLLEAAGVNINLTPAAVAACVRDVGVGFMFAPRHHSAMKHAIGPRREMGVRTVFNLLGPLTNPAGATRQLLGVYARQWVRPIAEVLGKLGSEHVLVVHGADGLDEISIGGPTYAAELRDGRVMEFEIRPVDVGLAEHSMSAIQVDGPEQSLAMIRDVLNNRPGAPRDVVLLNAGAAIYVGGAAATLKEGVAQAEHAIASGAARETLARLVRFSQSLGDE